MSPAAQRPELRRLRSSRTFGRRLEDVPPPVDLDAERNLLGAILKDGPSALAMAQGYLRDGADFHDPLHGDVYRAICTLHAGGHEFDEITVRTTLERDGPVGKVEFARLAALRDGVHKGAPVGEYASIVAEKARRRRLGQLGDRLLKDSFNGAGTDQIGDLVAAINKETNGSHPTLPAEDAADVLGRPFPRTPTAVEGLLAEGDVAITSGPGGVGKTWVAEHVGLALARGRDVFDRYRVTRRYQVAYLDLESRAWEVDQRLHRLAAGMGLDADALRGRVQIIRCRLRLDAPGDVARLMASIKIWGTEWLIVDSLRRAFRGDANKAEVVSDLFVETLDRIRLETGCGVILTDHTRKRTGEVDLDSPDQALIGSVDKRNMADAHFGVEDRQGRLAFIPTKTRHTRRPEPVLLEITGLAEADPDDGPVTVRFIKSLDVASDKVQDAIVALLSEGDKFRGEIVGRCGYSERAVDDALTALKKRGRVSKAQEGKQARYSLRPQRPQTAAVESEVP